ncbi:PmoA family protein [Paenarthrobacter aurescens]|uniref:PmoA family protein n=1 Tax=Paenarthrobacter aurescens TaxID=43663 RepID=UPI0021C064BB|nr:PmoA family protein [Paenarthrobacter aurescens]MCT9871324.1 PmoA family protein [Paenarthrobacter aurescens]
MRSFHVKGANVVQENPGDDLATRMAPRPYLHPVRTVAGVVLTEAAPEDHPHHFGLSLAFSDVNGTNFWGGSTYTENGPAVLPNHGRQVPSGWKHQDGHAEGSIAWINHSDQQVASERRSYSYQEHPAPNTWSLSFASVIRPAGAVEQLSVSSSAVKGRTGAGYGGIFWRFPSGDGPPQVFCSAGAGAEAAHGSLSPWLLVGIRHHGKDASVILAQDPGQLRPWFVRTEGYVGAGPAVAWDKPATADRDKPLTLNLHAVIHDGKVANSRHAEELLHQHFTFRNSPDRTP